MSVTITAPGQQTSEAIDRAMRKRRLLTLMLDYGLYAALVSLVVYFSIASPYFLSTRNLFNIAMAIAVTGILAAGFTAALIAGQVDISIGATVGMSGVVFAVLQEQAGLPWFLAALVSLAVGMLTGLLSGLLVILVSINSLIATLAMSTLITGLGLILAEGQPIPLTGGTLGEIVNARPLGIPVPVIILAVVFAAGWIVFNRMRLGWHIYAVGANPSAALRAGINVNKICLGLFVLSGGLAALGGLISTGQGGSAFPGSGDALAFQVLAAVLLAGFGISGGVGKFERALVGVLLVGVLLNGLVLMQVEPYYQYLARGVIFVLAVVLASVSLRKSAR
ncbi:ABC transporter permease [Lentzea sp. NPDC058450]|uniref:ABC transporter permease n=1 Tax=Lentzea sp. NPDC058450 TaxID=3346505 RepID=UPI003664E8EE